MNNNRYVEDSLKRDVSQIVHMQGCMIGHTEKETSRRKAMYDS